MALESPVVVRQIGSRPLYLGSSRAAHEGGSPVSFRYVLSLGPVEHPLTTHHVPLEDGHGVSQAKFEKAVETAISLHRTPHRVLIQCQAGISRSAAVIAAVIAIEEGTTFRAALEDVKVARQRASPRQPLREFARRIVQSENRSRLAAD